MPKGFTPLGFGELSFLILNIQGPIYWFGGQDAGRPLHNILVRRDYPDQS
jgi:hypothetical protein